MAIFCMQVRASNFASTDVSSRRPLSVRASARPTCLAPLAGPQKFCRSFRSDYGLRLLSRKPVALRRFGSTKVCAKAGSLEGNIKKEAHTLRRLGWVSFWAQLALSIVSATILSFAVTSSMQSPGGINVSVWFTLFGVASSFISTFFSFSYVKLARQSFSKGDVTRETVSARLLRNNSLNLWGLGATLLGLQAVIGGLVAKTLTTSSTNPYAQGGAGARAAPVALDVFSVQASANTLLAHFVSIVFTNMLLRTLNKATPSPKAAY
ncbi:hypothetical protein ABBQ38_015191 [Trebouxia sp. C0009 RCD-2024]